MAVQIQDEEEIQRLLDEDDRENLHETNEDNAVRFRKTSRHVAMNKLGLGALVDQKNERGLGSMHLAACEGNVYVKHNFLLVIL